MHSEEQGEKWTEPQRNGVYHDVHQPIQNQIAEGEDKKEHKKYWSKTPQIWWETLHAQEAQWTPNIWSKSAGPMNTEEGHCSLAADRREYSNANNSIFSRMATLRQPTLNFHVR